MHSWARCFKIHLGCFSPPRGFIRYHQTVWKQYYWKVIWHPLKAQSDSILENLREWGFKFQDIWVKFWATQNNNKMLGVVTCHCLVYPVGKGREAMFPYAFCQWKLDEFWPSGANSSMTLNPWGGQLFSRRQLFYCSFHFADPVYSNQVLPWDHLYWTQEIWKIQPSMVQIPKLVGWFAVYRLCCRN